MSNGFGLSGRDGGSNSSSGLHTSSKSDKRHGSYRPVALEEYGLECDECGEEYHEDQSHLIHVHHEEFISEEGGNELDNLRVLCHDCHIDLHSGFEGNISDVTKIGRVLADNIDHKKHSFADGIRQRVKLGSVCRKPGTRVFQVEGLLEGDGYDEYIVDLQSINAKKHLSLCTCYKHKWGGSRAVNICTHVGCSIVETVYKKDIPMDRKMKLAKKYGEELNKSAKVYVAKKKSISEGIDELKAESGFKKSHFAKGKPQALRMVKYGHNKWDCFAGPCEGATVTVGRGGYTCSIHGNDYPPCPGGMGAYILNKLDIE